MAALFRRWVAKDAYRAPDPEANPIQRCPLMTRIAKVAKAAPKHPPDAIKRTTSIVRMLWNPGLLATFTRGANPMHSKNREMKTPGLRVVPAGSERRVVSPMRRN